MITTTQRPSIELGFKMSQQLMYDNAIAVFGIVPIFAYMTLAFNSDRSDIVEYCKRAMLKFKDYKKLRELTEKNTNIFNSGAVIMVNDINVFDIYLKDLGYYESYNKIKLESDVKELVQFLEIGL